MVIAPSILSADFGRLAEEVKAVEEAGADWIHLDVMDGRFVPNITIGPPVVRCIRKATKLPLDVHLMIEEPERYVGAFRDAGADMISIHVESTKHLQRTLVQVRELGAKPAVALNPATPLYFLDHIWNDVEMVLVMTVNPGFGGQSFIPDMVNKIRALSKKLERSGPHVKIEVDGGIDSKNIGEIAHAGASVFVAGSAVFSTPDYHQNIARLREGMKKTK